MSSSLSFIPLLYLPFFIIFLSIPHFFPSLHHYLSFSLFPFHYNFFLSSPYLNYIIIISFFSIIPPHHHFISQSSFPSLHLFLPSEYHFSLFLLLHIFFHYHLYPIPIISLSSSYFYHYLFFHYRHHLSSILIIFSSLYFQSSFCIFIISIIIIIIIIISSSSSGLSSSTMRQTTQRTQAGAFPSDSVTSSTLSTPSMTTGGRWGGEEGCWVGDGWFVEKRNWVDECVVEWLGG